MQVEQTHYISVTSVKAMPGQLLMSCVCSSAVWEKLNKLASWCRKRMLLNTMEWSKKSLKHCEPKENGFSVFHFS